MLVGLYTSRVVLNALGETDYGIYSVVGGVVAMFTMISGALNSAVSRFITFELGKGDPVRLNKVYSTSVNIQLMLALIVVLLAEPIGCNRTSLRTPFTLKLMTCGALRPSV